MKLGLLLKKRNFIGISLFLAIVSPVIILAFFSYKNSKQEIINFTLAQKSSLARLTAITLKERFDRMKDLSLSLSTRVKMRQLISEGKWKEASQILAAVPRDFPFINRILFANLQGVLMADIPYAPEVKGMSFAHRDWYKGVMKTGKTYVSEIYTRTAQPSYNVVAFATPIQSEKGSFLGILVLQVTLDTFLEWSKNVEAGPEAVVYFLDHKGQLAGHPRFAAQGEIVDYSRNPVTQKILQGKRGTEHLFGEEERIVAYEPVPEYHWGVVVEQPLRVAFAAFNSGLRNVTLIYGVIFILSCLCALLVLRNTVKVRPTEEAFRAGQERFPSFSNSSDEVTGRLKNFSKIASLLVMLIAGFVFSVWLFDITAIKNFLSGLLHMKVNTALAFLLAGLSLWFFTFKSSNSYGIKNGQILAVAVAVIGLLTLSEYLFGWNLHIDQFLAREDARFAGSSTPCRMGPNTAFNFLLLGLSLLLWRGSRGYRKAQFLILIVILIAFLGLFGHIYGVGSFYELSKNSKMSLPTALSFITICLGILCSRPEAGFMRLVTSNTVGAIMLRRLLPIAIMAPFLLGWLRIIGQKENLYGMEFGTALVAIANITIFVTLIWYNAKRLHVADLERKKIEEENRNFFTLSLDMLCIAGFDGYFKKLNPSWEKTLGYTVQELCSKPFIEFVHPEDREKTVGESGKIATGMEAISFENRYLCKDGSYKWMLWSATPSLETELIYATARDITERRQMEEELKASEERFRSVTQTAKEAIVLANGSGNIILWNQGAQSTFGYSEEEALGRPLTLLMPERYQKPHRQGLERFLKTGQPRVVGKTVELHGRRKDGSEFPLELSLSSWKTGNDIFFSGILRDITERKQMEETLRDSEQRYRLLFDENPMPAWVFELQTLSFLAVNRAAIRHYGYSQEEFLKMTIKDIRPTEDIPALLERVSKLKEGVHSPGEWRHLKKDGTILDVEIASHPLTFGGRKAELVLANDITERKKAEEELHKLNESLKYYSNQLESANKELESFSYSVSHDLRAPLRSIDGFSLALLEDYGEKLDQEGKQNLTRVRDGCKRMSQLIDDMLNLSRLTRAEMRPEKVNLTSLAQEIISELKNIEPDRKVEVAISDNLFAHCDLQLIRAVLENLLNNAWKYTSKHPKAKIELGSLNQNGKPVFYVKDDGAGFDMRYADKLFGAFQRLHRMDEFEGNGVGLATVKRVIHRHGGKVWAEAEPEKGATFYFTL